MNIFYIPSWYPGKNSPYTGIFFKEQTLNIAGLYPKHKIFINLWGHEDFALHPRSPLESIKKIARRYKTKFHFQSIAPNVWEIYEPRLSWSHKIFKGNIRGIISGSIHNFQKVEERFGRISLIHAHVSFPAGFIAWRLSEQFQIPYIISEHMGPFPFREFLENGRLPKIISEPLKYAQAISAVSPTLKRQMEKFGFQNIQVIPNMVDERFFSLAPKKKPRKTFTFFSLSEISEEKGIDDLIKAIFNLTKKRQDVIFRIGGSSENMAYYQKLAKSMDLGKYIKWLGQISRTKVRSEIHFADAFILPSHYESFSMVTAEALSCGKPVIATRSGGPESMVNKANGILVDVGDISSMVEAIEKMIDNIISYQNSRIRHDFLKKFSRQVVAEEIINLYEKICVE